MKWLRRLFCFHTGERRHITNYMTLRGPRHMYQCERCGDYFTEPW